MSFPKMLDHASVLYYTSENCYGEVYYTTGENITNETNYEFF